MSATPNVRGRHAWIWLLGMTLASVLAIGWGLQGARSRAERHWDSVVSHLGEEGPRSLVLSDLGQQLLASGHLFHPQARVGNVFRGWRQGQWNSPFFTLVLRQERGFFGSRIEARMTDLASKSWDAVGTQPEVVERVRDLFDAVGVELVVEP